MEASAVLTFDKLPRCTGCGQIIRLDQAPYRFNSERHRSGQYLHGICGALDAADRGFAEPLLAR